MSFAAVLMRRGAEAAAKAEARAARSLADLVADEIEGVDAEAGAGGIQLTGRGLWWRAEMDARLRWLACFWRGR